MNAIAMAIGYLIIGTVFLAICYFFIAMLLNKITLAYAFTRGAHNINGMIKPGQSLWSVFWWKFKNEKPEAGTTYTSMIENENRYVICTWNSFTNWSYYKKK